MTAMLLILSLTLPASPAPPPAKAAPPALTGPESELRALDEKFAAAFGKEDLEALMAYYAEDAVVMDPGPALWHRGKTAIREGFSGMFTEMDSVQLVIHDGTYVVHGNVGYGYGLWDLTAKDAKTGNPVTMKGRSLAVFEKRKGSWVCVVDHASPPLPPAPPAPSPAASPAAK